MTFKFKHSAIAITMTMILALAAISVGAQDNGGRRGGQRGPGGDNTVVLEYTGLTAEELHAALENGATLGELIEANGASVDAFVTAAVSAQEERINAAVESGRIDAEQAAERSAELTENITNRLNGTFEGRQGGGQRGGQRDNTLALEYTGLTDEELRTALENGATLGELIEANGASTEAFVTAAVSAQEERINAAVESGRIDAEQAAERSAELTENITNRLNGTFEGRQGGGQRGGQRGFGGNNG